MGSTVQTTFTLYPVGNYTFGTKAPKAEKESNPNDRMARLQAKYKREGLRRTVDGVLLVHEHNHPHVLVLQIGSSYFKLPGGRLQPGEDEVEGLLRKMHTHLAPTSATLRTDWQVGEVAGVYYRPNFEPVMYPYLPPHITQPKEVKRLYVVHLPEKCYFAVPRNMRLLAVPLFELYDNVQRYGPVISALPILLSRFRLNLAQPGGFLTLPAPMLGDVAPHDEEHRAAGAAANGDGYGGGEMTLYEEY